MAPLYRRKTQIAVATGTVGTEPTWSNVETAANANILVYDPQINYSVGRFDRNPLRSQIGTLASVPTTETAELSFTCELKGSGTAGVAPSIGKLLRACSMTQTANTGTASIGTVYKQSESTGTGAVPVLTGTYTGTKSGILEIQITAVTTNTSIVVQATFYPGDGSAPSTGSFTQNSGSAVALTGVAAGVSFDFGDPSSSTTGYVIGDAFRSVLVSDQTVEVTYVPREPDGSSVYVDISYLQDGRAHRLFSCVGTWEITGTVGEIATIRFTMTGRPATVADVSLLTGINFEDTVPPAFMGITSLDLLGESDSCFSSVGITLGNTIAYRMCASEAKGIESPAITGRAVVGTIDPEADLVANFNTFGLMRAGTESALDFQVGSTSGNIVKFEAPRVEITNIEDTDRDGILVDGLTLRFNQPEYSGTNQYQEFTLTFK